MRFSGGLHFSSLRPKRLPNSCHAETCSIWGESPPKSPGAGVGGQLQPGNCEMRGEGLASRCPLEKLHGSARKIPPTFSLSQHQGLF